MILKRLYELAQRKQLADDPAFETQPVPYIIKVGPAGEYLGIEERRGSITIPAKKGLSKVKPDKGKELAVTKAHGNTANPGFARFFVDTLARVLPFSDEPKSVASRKTFWKQIEHAAQATGDPALSAVAQAGQSINSIAQRIKAEMEQFKPGPGDRCTFAWHPDEGATIIERDAVRQFWRSEFASVSGARQAEGPEGLCQITERKARIATTHANRIQGIPKGMSAGASLVSNDKDAFKSYGLLDAANACISWDAADAYTRALIALLSNKLPGSASKSCLRIGDIAVLFWTRNGSNSDDLASLMESPDPAAIEKLFDSAQRGSEASAFESNDFYCLMLSANSARVVVRDYLEQPVSRVRGNLAAWFGQLRIIDMFKKEITCAFPLWMLAAATVRKGDDVAPATPTLLLDAALKGGPISDSILGACIRRLHVEGSEGFRPNRIALIRLALIRANLPGAPMTETLDPSQDSAAYICGRLLAVFERIQWAALGDVNATIIDRFYGTASTAPSLVFPRFFKSAEQHLSKLSSAKPGFAVNLRKDIESLSVRLKDFPGLLSLADQGRFALGFYHQRAEYRTRTTAPANKSEPAPASAVNH